MRTKPEAKQQEDLQDSNVDWLMLPNEGNKTEEKQQEDLQNSNVNWLMLPTEVWDLIISFLNEKDLFLVCLVCKLLCNSAWNFFKKLVPQQYYPKYSDIEVNSEFINLKDKSFPADQRTLNIFSIADVGYLIVHQQMLQFFSKDFTLVDTFEYKYDVVKAAIQLNQNRFFIGVVPRGIDEVQIDEQGKIISIPFKDQIKDQKPRIVSLALYKTLYKTFLVSQNSAGLIEFFSIREEKESHLSELNELNPIQGERKKLSSTANTLGIYKEQIICLSTSLQIWDPNGKKIKEITKEKPSDIFYNFLIVQNYLIVCVKKSLLSFPPFLGPNYDYYLVLYSLNNYEKIKEFNFGGKQAITQVIQLKNDLIAVVLDYEEIEILALRSGTRTISIINYNDDFKKVACATRSSFCNLKNITEFCHVKNIFKPANDRQFFVFWEVGVRNKFGFFAQKIQIHEEDIIQYIIERIYDEENKYLKKLSDKFSIFPDKKLAEIRNKLIDNLKKLHTKYCENPAYKDENISIEHNIEIRKDISNLLNKSIEEGDDKDTFLKAIKLKVDKIPLNNIVFPQKNPTNENSTKTINFTFKNF